jgi:dephospho-CoA kinase
MTTEDFNNSELFIMTPYEVSNINKNDRKSSFIIFIDIPEEIRYNRILERNDSSDKVTRRIESDREDFNNFSDYDLKLCDSEFNIDDVYSLINHDKVQPSH